MPNKKAKKLVKKAVPKKRVKRVSLTRRLARFVPAVAFFGAAAIINLAPAIKAHGSPGVLAYATSISSGDLLSSTNAQRAGGSISDLTLNAQLASAAQTKANDMVARDYWSHVTPDGKEPWDFMTAAGYSFKTAGENLAYGFATSSDTVTGWMNSPPHRQNLMNPAFLDVGFGFANSANFVGSGEQTIVVAMYGAQSGSSAPAPVATPPPAPAAKVQPSTKTPEAAPAEEQPISTPVPVTVTDTPTPVETKTETPAAEPVVAAPTDVRRIQVLTAGNATWSSTLLVASLSAVGVIWILQRGRQIRRLLLEGEHFLIRHAHFDLAFLGFLMLGWTLLQTSGVIR